MGEMGADNESLKYSHEKNNFRSGFKNEIVAETANFKGISSIMGNSNDN